MSVYLGYLVLTGLQSLLFYKKDRFGERHFNSRPYVWICCIELILLAGLRGYTVGADTATYLKALDYYNAVPILKLPITPLVYPFDFEVGYFTLTKICAFFGMSKTAFLFLIAMIIYIPVFVTIQKHSRIPYLSILSYFAFGMFTYSLGIFRQMIAISILLCGWKYVRERKLLMYLIFIGLAMLFHATAIIAILLYLLYGVKWRRIIWFVFPAEILFVVFGRQMAMLAFSLLPQYSGYIGKQYDQQGGSYLMLLLLNVILITCIILDKRGRFSDDMTICALILAVLIQPIGYSMAIFGRIVPYFSIYLIFALPDAVYGMGKTLRKFAGIAAVAILFFLVYRTMNGDQYITPYYTFFENIGVK